PTPGGDGGFPEPRGEPPEVVGTPPGLAGHCPESTGNPPKLACKPPKIRCDIANLPLTSAITEFAPQFGRCIVVGSVGANCLLCDARVRAVGVAQWLLRLSCRKRRSIHAARLNSPRRRL